jgi:hypothetical protein
MEPPAPETSSFHARHRATLARLASDEAMLPLLGRAGEECGWWTAERRWTRTWSRLDVTDPPRATLLFETEDAPRAICVLRQGPDAPPARSPDEIAFPDPTLGWITLTRFPFDPALPTLACVLNARPGAEVVRYRPGRRCTLRDRGAAGEPCYVKVFPDDRGARVDREAQELWRAVGAGEIDVRVARPRGFDPELRAVIQSELRGKPAVALLRGTGGARLAERLGRAAASIPAARLAPANVLDAAAELARTRTRARELTRLVPSLAAAVDHALTRLAALHARLEPRPLRPIHGSLHPQQWLVDGDRPGLVDFDRLSLGDPELDVATFLAEVDFEDPSVVPVAAVCAAFVRGYRSRWPFLDADLLRAYRAQKRLAKAVRSARALRPDADRRAALHLDHALRALDAEDLP